jgi:hypothetical protein
MAVVWITFPAVVKQEGNEMRKRVALILSALLMMGATYHFDESGGNDSTGDGSIGTPYRTLAGSGITQTTGDIYLYKRGESQRPTSR